MNGGTRIFSSLNGPSIEMDKNSINISPNNSIRLADILRVDLDKDVKDSSTVRILHYPLVKERRTRKEFSISLAPEEAMELQGAIKKAIALKPPPHRPRNSSKRLLVIVNPFSGQKKARDLWRDEAERVLSDGQWLCEVVETTHPGHAVEIAKNIDLDKYSGILVNSGDGLLSEVFTGILLRRDRARALKLPVGHLPGGTSNALASAICFACNESFSPRYGFMREAAVMAARPTYRPLRLFKAEVEGSGRVPMFMSTTWGLIADIDIESERFRWAGMIRLHIEAILIISQLPKKCKYRARISYIPVGDKELTRKTMLKYNAERHLFGKKHFNFETVEAYTGESQPSGQYSSIAEALSSSSAPCPAAPRLPPLDQPITSSAFTVLEGEYVFACLTSLSHLGSDLPYLPSAKLDEDDIFYLTLIDWSIIKHRLEVGALMITIDGSRHLSYPCFQVIPVRACRIEPLDGCGGNVAVDGEPKGKGKAFQVEALPMAATVIGREEVKR
ncbi:hypothetical protein PENTCL1PPCAC_2537 [Pristionchus entomophagus]|uniref:DAGKc domain-containing protein n=1 Tax=Pristionchus entomophagus TaxID=358040 RepID=A0AAV5SCD8_9BILA|nr:hypothetical protein PENTCL1PPCAC_2537 [Pristionchus entomophagus]